MLNVHVYAIIILIIELYKPLSSKYINLFNSQPLCEEGILVFYQGGNGGLQKLHYAVSQRVSQFSFPFPFVPPSEVITKNAAL